MQSANRGVGSEPAVASKNHSYWTVAQPTGMPGQRDTRLRTHYLGTNHERSTVRVGMAGWRQRHSRPEKAAFRPGAPDPG